MASISKDKQGNKTIQFMAANRKRRSIRIGKMPAKDATTIKTHIESILAANFSGNSYDRATSEWLGRIDAALYDKLANAGLVQKRKARESATLAAFLDSYLAGRSDVKGTTAAVFGHTRRNLIQYFGADKLLEDITLADADSFRRWLSRPVNKAKPKEGGQGLMDSTARRRCGFAKQYFRAALRSRLIQENPFADMKLGGVATKDRDYFVTREQAQAVLDACPDVEWKLIFALSRFGGLRCSSEHLALRWGDVDWERGRILVHSPKTEHHEGKEERTIPLFPELRPHLQAALDELLEAFDPKLHRLSEQPVIVHRRGGSNFGTHMQRIIRKAGLTPWPKLFMNLRANRATELAAEHPAHVAAEWLGHSTMIAQKHYWRVTESDFAKALQNPVQQPNGTERSEAQEQSEGLLVSLDCGSLRSCAAEPDVTQ